MGYFSLYICVAIWIYMDSKKRLFKGIPYSIATVFLGPIVAPYYLAKRNLKKGEVREGGLAWNVLKNFALFWTVTMIIVAIAGMVGVSDSAKHASSQAAQAGTAIGAMLGMGMLFFLWFVPMISALVLGLFLKKATIVENGPTGELVSLTTTT
jgi:hypothetical protein